MSSSRCRLEPAKPLRDAVENEQERDHQERENEHPVRLNQVVENCVGDAASVGATKVKRDRIVSHDDRIPGGNPRTPLASVE